MKSRPLHRSRLRRQLRRLHRLQVELLELRQPLAAEIGIADAQHAEFDTGTSTMSFQVRLTEPTATPVKVDYTTVPGTAGEGNDYQDATNSLTFVPGQTVRTIDVIINGDTVAENHETFTVQLSNPSGATLADASATGTILNDDEDGSISTMLQGQPASDLSNGVISAFATIRGRIESVASAAGDLPVIGDQIMVGMQPFLDDLAEYESKLSDKIGGVHSSFGRGGDQLITLLRDGMWQVSPTDSSTRKTCCACSISTLTGTSLLTPPSPCSASR